MSGETKSSISSWTVDTLKAFLEQDNASLRTELEAVRESIKLARTEMERRLGELNQLRKEVTDDRSELVQKQQYDPAHKELQKQVNELAGKILTITSDVSGNASEISTIRNSLSWLTRLIVGALVLAVIAWIFQKIGR